MQKKYAWIWLILILVITACDVLPQAITPSPTRRFSAATLAPTEAITIQNSDEIYGDTIRDGQSNATAAALPVDAPLPPLQSGGVSATGAQPIQIFLADSTLITGDLYEHGSTDNRSAGILILAQEATSWGNLAPQLFEAGYTVLVVNLGNRLFADDLNVLLRSLSENGAVDPARIAVIGAESTADMALLGCAIDAICDAVVMLSPQSRGAILNLLPKYNPRPMFISDSPSNSDSYAT
ncbi:MAG: hypothetical protein WBC91_21110, partial [Phototrophicaceae bacterium]